MAAMLEKRDLEKVTIARTWYQKHMGNLWSTTATDSISIFPLGIGNFHSFKLCPSLERKQETFIALAAFADLGFIRSSR